MLRHVYEIDPEPSGLFSKGSSTTTQSAGAQPWAPTIPGLQMGINSANQAFQSGVGSQPYTASMVTPFSAPTTQAFGNIQHRANAWQPYFNRMGEQVGALQGQGGMDALTRLSAQQLAPIASGQAMQQNPYLDEVINRSAADITGAQNMAASAAGRYGSGGYSGRHPEGDCRYGRTAPLCGLQHPAAAHGSGHFFSRRCLASRRGKISPACQAPWATPSSSRWHHRMRGWAWDRPMKTSTRANSTIRNGSSAEQQAQPWANINNLNAALQGTAAPFRTTTGSATSPTPSMASGLIGGGLAGASMFKDAAGNPSGWGALLGGLGGLLS